MPTKSEAAAIDLVAQFKAREKLIWIVSNEEEKVERWVFEAAASAKYVARFWDAAAGVTELNGDAAGFGSDDAGQTIAAMQERGKVEEKKERGVLVMRDLPPWLQGPIGVQTLRRLRNFCRSMEDNDSAQSIVVVTPSNDIPPELANHVSVVEWPLPDRDEIADLVDDLIKQYGLQDVVKNGKRAAAIDAGIGLSEDEAKACYSRSIVQFKTIDPGAVSKEKKRIITKEGLLEWCDPIPAGLDAVGGLENLKSWLLARASAYTVEARAYGLPRPKGTFLIGISGCGKSLCCKSIATAWQCPLIRVDMNALKSKYVGESEQKLRRALKIIEALGFCVVWFDEVEKALQGATSGSSDGGVSSDAMGTILTWMQERKSDAFVIMTANDVTQLPPEFMRKGRFDEVWWVDLPNKTERVEVLKAALREHKRGHVEIDHAEVASQCDGFTGSEIAAIVPDALYAAFADKAREIETRDLIAAAEAVTPLSRTAKEKIDAMRAWSKGRARTATKTEVVETQVRRTTRALDVA